MGDLTKVKMRVPLGSYKSDRTEAQALNELQLTKTRAGVIVRKVAEIHQIPQDLALAFTCIETGGLAIRSADGVSYGMMQTNAATLDGVIKFAFKYGMTIEEFKYIFYSCKPAFSVIQGKTIPPLNWSELNLDPLSEESRNKNLERLKIMSQPVSSVLRYTNPNLLLTSGGKYNAPSNVYNQKMNKDPYFGVHIGCIYLYELITKSLVTEAGEQYLRLDWVINGYNGGYYSRFNPWINKNQEKLSSDVWLAQPNVPAVTKSYVRRLAGVGGYMQLIVNGKFEV